jgi:hypothetical protein
VRRRDFARVVGLAFLSRAVGGCYLAHETPCGAWFSDTATTAPGAGFSDARGAVGLGGVLASAHGETDGSGAPLGE